MANFRGKIQTDLGLSKFSQYRPVGRVRADTSAKPVLDASARTFEALGNLSPTLMKLAAYQVGLQKEEIRSEEQKRFASASLEERRKFAEGEALEEEKQNPAFAGSNPWRRVIRQEIAGKHAAEVNLLSELERRRDSLTDHDRSIEDIKSEMQSLQAQYRPDSLYGGRAYDASAAAVVQQNEGRFLAIRGRKQEAATAEAITTGIQDQLVLGAEGEGVDFGAIRDLLDRYHSLTGKSGKDFLAASVESVVGIYEQRFKSGSISLEDYEDSITALYGVTDSMVEPSAEGSQVAVVDSGGTYAHRKDEETGELVPPKLRVQAIESSGKSHFVVIPEDMSQGDFEAAAKGGVYERFPTFALEEDARAFAAGAESFRPDGTQKKAASPVSSFGDLQQRAALEARLEKARSFDAAEYARNRDAALLRVNDDIKPRVARLIQEGKNADEIREELLPLLAAIGEETGFEELVDADDIYEDGLVRDAIRMEVEAQGVSIAGDEARLTSAVINGTASALDVAYAAGVSASKREQLLKIIENPEAFKQTMVSQHSPSAAGITLAIKSSDIRNQWEVTDPAYISDLTIRFQEEFVKRAFDSIPLGEMETPDRFEDALREQAKPENVQEIVNFLVADDIRERDPGVDVNGLLGSKAVARFLQEGFGDETAWDDAAGRIVRVEPMFYDAMLRWVTEYRETNPDVVPSQMVEDFISEREGGPGFRAFYGKTAETDAQEKVEVAAIPKEEMTPEQAQLFEERAAEDMRERERIVGRREEAVKEALGGDVDVPSWQDVPKWRSSNVDKVNRFREEIPKLREQLRAVDPNFERSRAYLDNDLVGDYKRAKSTFQTGQKKLYEGLMPDDPKLMQETPRESIRGRLYLSSDEYFQEVIDEGETDRPFLAMNAFGNNPFTYGHIVEATLEYRFYGHPIDGEPSHITTEELATGMLRFPHREVRVPVPRAELHPHKYIMVADKDQLDSYTDEDWMSLYGNLDATVQADLDNFVERGAADNIPELLKGMQEDLLYRLYRIDLEDDLVGGK